MSKNKKIKLSASKIKTLDMCSWLYYCQYVLKVPQTTNVGASRGLCAHIVLECFVNKRHKKHYDYAVDDIITPAVERLIIKNAIKLNIPLDDDSGHISLIKSMISTACKFDFFCKGSEKVEAETEFKIEFDDFFINGFIDKRAFFKKNKIKIIDYKTSKSKFSNEEIQTNLQGLIYSLATYKMYGVVPEVEFHFLKFPKNPIQFFEKCSESQLDGFAMYLENVARFLNHFNEETALTSMAAKSKEKSWLCGKEGFKNDGTPHYICQYRKPSTYFVLKNKQGEILASSFKKEDLKPKDDEKIFLMKYQGCPYFNNSKKVIDNFDF